MANYIYWFEGGRFFNAEVLYADVVRETKHFYIFNRSDTNSYMNRKMKIKGRNVYTHKGKCIDAIVSVINIRRSDLQEKKNKLLKLKE